MTGRMPDAGDLALILDAATEAGRLALDLRARGLSTEMKADHTPVSNGDIAVDTFLKERLGRARPDYGWLSEETVDDASRHSKRRLFMVDPIDGTRAYVKGRPWFVVSIAVVEDGQPTAAVLVAPALDETYSAEVGGGAWLNGSRIHPSDRTALEGCAMLADAPMMAHPAWRTPWPPMRVETRNSIAYRMGLVAAGTFDAAITLSPKSDWDLAAGALIMTEAGASVSDHKGQPLAFNTPRHQCRSLICATPALAPLILARTSPIDLPE